MTGPTFYLGTHKPYWLWDRCVDFPLFVSHRQLSRAGCKISSARKLYPATHSWALDSGGFSELSNYGAWRTSPEEYVQAVATYAHEIGQLDWAAPQDWMCEPAIIYGGKLGPITCPGTKLSVEAHQLKTVINYLELSELWELYSDLPSPFIPVLQGWTLGDYERCAELYRGCGVDLHKLPRVGLGSVCRRQSGVKIGLIANWFASEGIKLHGFGVKLEGLDLYAEKLTSCDSLAWSYDARRAAPMPGHTHSTCSNCLPYAMAWRSKHFGSQLAA